MSENGFLCKNIITNSVMFNIFIIICHFLCMLRAIDDFELLFLFNVAMQANPLTHFVLSILTFCLFRIIQNYGNITKYVYTYLLFVAFVPF